MVAIARKTPVLEGVTPEHIPFAELLEAGQPAILKGVARNWPLVRRGLESAGQAMEYLRKFANGKQVLAYTGPPEIKGRFFYNADLTGLNFATERAALGDILDRISAQGNAASAPSFYVGSTDVDGYLPGLRAENDLILNDAMFQHNQPLVSIWIGNRTVASAHYDQFNNIACCMVGRRRFSLFPPEQIRNLYPGPLEPTPGGQVVSMVDFSAPDIARFPGFREALAAGQVAELDPGDLLFYPALWWHHVEALDSFNAMINYWWTTVPEFMDSPQTTLLHALMSLRDRSEREKQAWQSLFDYYVFGAADRAGQHLPAQVRGNLAPMDEGKARRLRSLVQSRLNR
jgi:hypothetical protein